MSKWISVKDKLPRDNDSVIAYRSKKGASNMYVNNDGWYQDGWGEISGETYSDITHWQPLPEPPEAE